MVVGIVSDLGRVPLRLPALLDEARRDLTAFTADHHACMAKGATDVGRDHVLVNLDVYRACLKVNGWTRQTGAKLGNAAGFYRGLEESSAVPRTFMPKQVGDTEGPRHGSLSEREIYCRRLHIDGRKYWREGLPADESGPTSAIARA